MELLIRQKQQQKWLLTVLESHCSLHTVNELMLPITIFFYTM